MDDKITGGKSICLFSITIPGGKGKLAPLMKLLIETTGHVGGTYIEPFAGGAGIALDLLENDVVNRIVINDFGQGDLFFLACTFN